MELDIINKQKILLTKFIMSMSVIFIIIFIGTISATAVEQPDLTITSISAPVSGNTATVDVSATVKNLGANAGVVLVDIYLSEDATITTGDTRLINGYTSPIASGGETTFTRTVSIPTYLDGNYYVGAVADPYNFIQETDETNNALGIRLYPNVPPVANAKGPYIGNESSIIILDGSASYDPDAGDSIISYEWDLDNDGTFDANGMTISKNWTDDYSGIVVLKVTDSYGESNITTTTVNVSNVAPTVEAIIAPIDPVLVGTTIMVSSDFHDVGILDTHIAEWDWNDNTTRFGIVNESTGTNGTVTGSHAYNKSGIYTIKLNITDDDGGKVFTEYRYVVVYDPDCESVTGAGEIDSPAGAYTLDTSMAGKANFSFDSKYKKGAIVPNGATEFQLNFVDFNFYSNNSEWLVIDGARAIYKGTGTINDNGIYGFILTGIDGAVNGDGTDKLRIEVWNEATGAIIYDNLLDGANDADLPAINGGNIVIHKK